MNNALKICVRTPCLMLSLAWSATSDTIFRASATKKTRIHEFLMRLTLFLSPINKKKKNDILIMYDLLI